MFGVVLLEGRHIPNIEHNINNIIETTQDLIS